MPLGNLLGLGIEGVGTRVDINLWTEWCDSDSIYVSLGSVVATSAGIFLQ